MSGVWASGGNGVDAERARAVHSQLREGRLFGRGLRREQRDWVDGHSEPSGPGAKSAGLALFRYRLSCGTVYRHTGHFFGTTQFAAASSSGRRSATVSVNVQYNQEQPAQAPFRALRRAFARAACAALARD